MALRVVPVANLPHLIDILENNGLDLSRWGQETAKSVEQLCKEIVEDRESELVKNEDGKLFRRVRVVKMLMEQPNLGILCEVLQILSDGKQKTRKPRPPSGKIKQGEDPAVRLVTEMREELGIVYLTTDYTFEACEVTEKEESSSSYPGLSSIYLLHWYRVTLSAAALAMIGPHEYRHLDPDTGNTLVFHWVPRECVNFN